MVNSFLQNLYEKKNPLCVIPWTDNDASAKNIVYFFLFFYLIFISFFHIKTNQADHNTNTYSMELTIDHTLLCMQILKLSIDEVENERSEEIIMKELGHNLCRLALAF